MVSEQRSPAPHGATLARILPGGNGRRTITRDYHRLINECTEKLLSNPKHTLAMRLRAQSYRMLGEDDAALADYNSLLALEPTNVDALFYRGTILERQQHIDEAIHCYTAVLQQEPQHHKALYNRAVCFSAKGSFAQAIEDFSAAIELDQQTCKGARRVRDQDPAQQQLASSLGATADAAAAAALHAGSPQPNTLPHHVLQQYAAEGHALSSATSVSDVSAAGWERLNSNTSAWSTTPQSTGSDALGDEEPGTGSGSGGSATAMMYDPYGAMQGGTMAGLLAQASPPSSHSYPEGPSWVSFGTGAALATARSHAGAQPHPHATEPEAGVPSLGPKQGHHDLHHPDQHGRRYRQYRQRQWASGRGEDAGALSEQQQQQAPSVHDSLGSWLEPRQSGGSSEAAWSQGADVAPVATAPPPPLQQQQQQQGIVATPPPTLPASSTSAQLLATLQDSKALHMHQQAQRQQQQQQQQAEDEYVLDQLQNMFVAAQQHEQQAALARQGGQQQQSLHAQTHPAPENGLRGGPHGVLREVQGQGYTNGRSQTPKGRAAVAAQRVAGAHVHSHVHARAQVLRAQGPVPGRINHPHQPQRHAQPPSRNSMNRTAPGSAPPAVARELRSPSPFERFVQDDRTPGAGASAAPRPTRNHTNGANDRHGTPPKVLTTQSRPNTGVPPQHPQLQQQPLQQMVASRPNTAPQQQPQQHMTNPRCPRDQRGDGGDGPYDSAAEMLPEGQLHVNGQSEQAPRLQSWGQRELLQVKDATTAATSGTLTGLRACSSGDLGDGPEVLTACGRGGSGGGGDGSSGVVDTAPVDRGADDGSCSLDPWTAGGPGGMVGAMEMSRPSTSSSAASDAADQSSRHKAIEQCNARAFALRQQGKLVEAVREYTRALELDPYHFKTLFNRGFTHDRLGELAAAVDDYTAALAVDPQSSYAHYNRGITRDRLQNFAGAVEDFTAAIRLEPNSADFYHNRGFALRKQGMFEAAIQDYTTAIRLNPNHCRAYYNRAFCHDRLNHVQQAIDDYTKALEMEPNNATALHNRGSLHERNGRSDLALQDFDRAIVVDPNCAQSYNARGVLLQHLSRLEEAQADLDMAVALMQPPSASLFRNRAQVRRERGDHYGAVQDLTRAIALDPLDLLSYSRRAHCFRRMGEYESAIRDYTRAIGLSPNNPKLHTIRAYCYAMIEWYGEAVADYDIVLSLEPSNAHASYNRSIALEKLGGAIDRAAAELSAAAGGVSAAAADRARQSVSAAAAHAGHGRSQGQCAAAVPEQPTAAYDATAGSSAAAAAVAAAPCIAPGAGIGSSGGGVQRGQQGLPQPKQAWASVDGRFIMQHTAPPAAQQQLQAGPPAVAATRQSGGTAAAFRGPSPMRGGMTNTPPMAATATGRAASIWGSGHPTAAMAQAAFQHRAPRGNVLSNGGVYASQNFYSQPQPQRQAQQQQQQWHTMQGGAAGAAATAAGYSGNAVPGGRSRTPHRAVVVP
ncbi:hypothetical protein Vretimale_17174 [Volvox reticuliferus]|uniref:Uncharacterized protein n=1 Tax=Volvox reticuliferus TaxID=1737510 RepID=A0A8J4FZS7_9CHLO|nr:hypothetical protein Vretifemale_18574 [Volvox reticuliferus]GIM14167.1 hypothetical protein Vretimale_17174 [Volvox reticuliferus]